MGAKRKVEKEKVIVKLTLIENCLLLATLYFIKVFKEW